MAAKKKSKKKGGARRSTSKKRRGSKLRLNAIFSFGILSSIIFLPTTIFLIVGLLPFFVVLFVDRRKKRSQAITVGAMNLAGCSPFLLEMWTSEHTISFSLGLIMNPLTIIIAYAAAAVGYLIDWSVTSFVANLMYQRGVSKKEKLVKRKEQLVERWGREVTGTLILDEDGFPLENQRKNPAKGAVEAKKEVKKK